MLFSAARRRFRSLPKSSSYIQSNHFRCDVTLFRPVKALNFPVVRANSGFPVPTDMQWTKTLPSIPSGSGDRVAQIDALSKIEEHLFSPELSLMDSDRRATVVMTGGSGKTRVGMRAVQRALRLSQEQGGVSRVLVLLPRLALMEQTLREYMSDENRSMLDDWSSQALCVCSSLDAPLKMSTDPAMIAEHLNQEGAKKLLVFSTYASARRIEEALLMTPGNPFSLMVCDEAHVTAGMGDHSGTVLHNKRTPSLRRLFTTATPRLLGKANPSSAANGEDGLTTLRSMDDEALYGPIVFKYTPSEAVAAGITVPVKIVVVEKQEAKSKVPALLEPTVAEIGFRALALEDFAIRFERKKIIVFNGRNSRAEQLHLTASELGSLDCYLVDGNMKAAEREAILFESRQASNKNNSRPIVIFNAHLLAEGYDDPTCDAVFLADDIRSHVKIQQVMARAARSAPGKTSGYFCLPLNSNDLLDPTSGAYQNLHNVLLGMVQQDESLLVDMRTWQMNLGSEDIPSATPDFLKEIIVFPEGVAENLVGTVKTVVFDIIGTWIPSWDKNFGHLVQFREKHDHCKVRYDYETDNGINLGLWVSTQRKSFHNDKLSDERIEQLNEIGFVWDVLAAEWNENFQRLKQYAGEHGGDSSVPKSFVTKDGSKLSSWVSNQRTAFLNGKLSDKKIEQLNEIGFVWDVAAAEWNENFQRLKQYAGEHGSDCSVPYKFVTKDGSNLGKWVRNQRVASHNGKLNDKQIEQLNEIGFVWDVFAADWHENFQRLKQYAGEHGGDSSVPRRFVTKDGSKLGNWVGNQRKAFLNGKLSDEKIEQLNETGFVWDVAALEWDENFQRLKQYAGEHGSDCSVPYKFVTKDGSKLGSWVGRQRKAFKKGKMSDERIGILNGAGFVWKV